MNVPAMNVPSWLKPENGWVGAALGTWLDFAKGGLATRFLLLWFVILYTAFQVISFASVGLNAAVLEVYALGQHPAAGYIQQAPLAALMTAGWFAAFPHTEWSFHLLAMVNAAIGLVAVDRIAIGYVAGRQAHRRAAPVAADAVLPVPRPALRSQRHDAVAVADRDPVLPARLRDPRSALVGGWPAPPRRSLCSGAIMRSS